MADTTKANLQIRIDTGVKPKTAASSSDFLKWTSLFILTAQNSSQAMMIRYSRTRHKEEMFLPTTTIFLTEVVKLVTCVVIVVLQEKGAIKGLRSMYDTVVKHPLDTLKVCVPSLIYTAQNNLIFVSISHLSATTFMVTYQLKILTTALFSVALLKRQLSKLQWLALLILFAGVSVIQLEEKTSSGSARTTTVMPNTASSTPAASLEASKPGQNKLIGLSAAIMAVTMSGFAGVYFEKVLKGSDITVWMRNVQLSVVSIPIALLTMFAKDGGEIKEHGVLYGYDAVVWVIVLLYSLGGLTVAAVVKYADNILKGFATSVAILVSCVASIFLFDFQPSFMFMGGLLLVFVAIYLYSKQ